MRTGPLQWAGGEHDFALNLGLLRSLQDRCDAGPEEVFTRLRNGKWRVNDLFEPIRLGLIGSGAMTQEKAGPAVLALMEQHPLVQFRLTAITILSAALVGVLDDPVGEPAGTATPENGGSAGSTAAAP